MEGKAKVPSAGRREESDDLGAVSMPREALHGVHAARAGENFPLTGKAVHERLIRAYGAVKLACAVTNRSLGYLEGSRADAVESSCREMEAGLLSGHVIVDCLQGGAGTSTNMNVNEVIANRALQLMGLAPGRYDVISPLDHVNLHQSTNDTFPTAMKLAAILLQRELEEKLVGLIEAFQIKEKEFADVVKIGRTEYQDAVLTTLGREMSAYAEALSRDRWRLYKCEERLRVVNLGGTAIGTGLGAPRQFIFRVVDALRELTGVGFARAENLVEATQNADVFVEVSGILKALAVTLLKISSDLRLMSSGPEAGLGEIALPPRQAGSSIMPGKVNPVIPEAVSQVSMMVMGHDQTIALAASSGSLELNPFLPLVAECLLASINMLANSCEILRSACVEGIEANRERCGRNVENSTATVTALLPLLGYSGARRLAQLARERGGNVKQAAIEGGFLTLEQFEQLTSPEAVCRLGLPGPIGK